MWYTKIYVYFFKMQYQKEESLMKKIWRGLWIAAVSLGGVALVNIALLAMKKDKKKYIDV